MVHPADISVRKAAAAEVRGGTDNSHLARMTDTRRRVKVYTLNEDRQWDDRGTGHVSSGYVDRFKATSLLVRAESDGEFTWCHSHVMYLMVRVLFIHSHLFVWGMMRMMI